MLVCMHVCAHEYPRTARMLVAACGSAAVPLRPLYANVIANYKQMAFVSTRALARALTRSRRQYYYIHVCAGSVRPIGTKA